MFEAGIDIIAYSYVAHPDKRMCARHDEIGVLRMFVGSPTIDFVIYRHSQDSKTRSKSLWDKVLKNEIFEKMVICGGENPMGDTPPLKIDPTPSINPKNPFL